MPNTNHNGNGHSKKHAAAIVAKVKKKVNFSKEEKEDRFYSLEEIAREERSWTRQDFPGIPIPNTDRRYVVTRFLSSSQGINFCIQGAIDPGERKNSYYTMTAHKPGEFTANYSARNEILDLYRKLNGKIKKLV